MIKEKYIKMVTMQNNADWIDVNFIIKRHKRNLVFKNLFMELVDVCYEYNGLYYNKNKRSIPIDSIYQSLKVIHAIWTTENSAKLDIEFAKYLNKQVDKLIMYHSNELGFDFDSDITIDFRGLSNANHNKYRVVNTGLTLFIKRKTIDKYNKRVRNRNKLYNKKGVNNYEKCKNNG